MSNDRQSGSATDADDAERALERLFAHAKPRALPPAADAEEIRRAVETEWDEVTGRRVFLRRAGFAVAGSVTLALIVWAALSPSSSDLPVVARVERVEGLIEGADGAPLVVGSALSADGVVTTGMGQIALRLSSGGSLRVDVQSRVALTSADAVELIAGVVYFDSEKARTGVPFTVSTDLGSVRDIGTQFLARLDPTAGQFDIGVRDGSVELVRGNEVGAAGVGERLVVTQDAATIRRDRIATFGGEWNWVERVAPPFDTDGRTVSDFLAWFSAQTGRTVTFGSTDAERLARGVVSGPIDLQLLQQLSAVLATADLTYTLEDDRVVINTR